jgi:hypothetical protein
VGIDRTMQKLSSKTCPGENKNMMNDANQKDEPPESEDLKNLDAIAKAFIVQMAWSYAEALERTKRDKNQQKPAPESQPESEAEPVDRPCEKI